MIWWAVSLDWELSEEESASLDPTEERARRFLGLTRQADRTPNIRSLQVGNRGLRCSVLAEDADRAVCEAMSFYEVASGQQIGHRSAARAIPEGDRNVV